MADEMRRVDIGFEGGQVLPIRMTRDAYDKLRKSLGGDGWHELETQDSRIAIDLAKVVYVRLDTEEHKVGF
jgi:hypothetical protein